VDPIKEFEHKKKQRIDTYHSDDRLIEAARQFRKESMRSLYSYNFAWMGRPIIQYPQDVLIMQELIWGIKPDLIIETGIAHGGSLIFYASMLELIGKGQVIGIDIEIRPHNRSAIEKHPMFKRIRLIEGDSVSADVFRLIRNIANGKPKILVCLDSNHTHDHVLKEMELYASMVSVGSYLVVFDTIIEDMPDHFFPDRPWGKGNNPKTAVWEFLKKNDYFEIDRQIEHKLLITVASDGYLKRIR